MIIFLISFSDSFSLMYINSNDFCVLILYSVLVYMLSWFSHVWLFVILWTTAHQAPLSIGLTRQKYWNGLPRPPSGHLPDPRIEPTSPTFQADSLPKNHQGSPFAFCNFSKLIFSSNSFFFFNDVFGVLYIKGLVFFSYFPI